MSVKLSIKLDNAKIRILLDGDFNTITQYLENKNYAAIHTALRTEKTKVGEAKLVLSTLVEEAVFQSTTINVLELAENGPIVRALLDEFSANFSEQEEVAQLASSSGISYDIPEYNLAYGFKESLIIEFWLPIVTHFNDDSLMKALAQLIEPLDLPCAPDVTPNMHVNDLKVRNYVTIFPPTETPPKLALQVIQSFEKLALSIVREKFGAQRENIPSQVNVSFTQTTPANHLKQLGVFGSASSVSAGAGATSAGQGACSSRYYSSN